jgi:hypothetical protein
MKNIRHSRGKPSTYILDCPDELVVYPKDLSGISWVDGDVVYLKTPDRRPPIIVYAPEDTFHGPWKRITEGERVKHFKGWKTFLEIIDELFDLEWMTFTTKIEVGYYVGKRPGLSRTRTTIRLLKLTEKHWNMIDLEFELKGFDPYRPIRDKCTKAPTGS